MDAVTNTALVEVVTSLVMGIWFVYQTNQYWYGMPLIIFACLKVLYIIECTSLEHRLANPPKSIRVTDLESELETTKNTISRLRANLERAESKPAIQPSGKGLTVEDLRYALSTHPKPHHCTDCELLTNRCDRLTKECDRLTKELAKENASTRLSMQRVSTDLDKLPKTEKEVQELRAKIETFCQNLGKDIITLSALCDRSEFRHFLSTISKFETRPYFAQKMYENERDLQITMLTAKHTSVKSRITTIHADLLQKGTNTCHTTFNELCGQHSKLTIGGLELNVENSVEKLKQIKVEGSIALYNKIVTVNKSIATEFITMIGTILTEYSNEYQVVIVHLHDCAHTLGIDVDKPNLPIIPNICANKITFMDTWALFYNENLSSKYGV